MGRQETPTSEIWGLLWQVYYWWLLLIPKFINFPLHGQDISPKETLKSIAPGA
jgi:hypothetical protein